jgi:hypothetical protein
MQSDAELLISATWSLCYQRDDLGVSIRCGIADLCDSTMAHNTGAGGSFNPMRNC